MGVIGGDSQTAKEDIDQEEEDGCGPQQKWLHQVRISKIPPSRLDFVMIFRLSSCAFFSLLSIISSRKRKQARWRRRRSFLSSSSSPFLSPSVGLEMAPPVTVRAGTEEGPREEATSGGKGKKDKVGEKVRVTCVNFFATFCSGACDSDTHLS